MESFLKAMRENMRCALEKLGQGLRLINDKLVELEDDIRDDPWHWCKLAYAAALMAFAAAGAYEAWLNISKLPDWHTFILWTIFVLRLISFVLAVAAFIIEQTDGPGNAAVAIATLAFLVGKYFYWLWMIIGLEISKNPALTPH